MRTVIIDPGHGGADPGAVSSCGVQESDLNLEISSKLAMSLLDHQEQVVGMTRATDRRIALSARCSYADQACANLLLSIHCNSCDTPRASGFEVWTSRGQDESDPFATEIFEALQAEFPTTRARADYYSDGDPDKERDYHVLIGSAVPAVLVECGFLSSGFETILLKTDEYQERLAKAIAQGVHNAFCPPDCEAGSQ